MSQLQSKFRNAPDAMAARCVIPIFYPIANAPPLCVTVIPNYPNPDEKSKRIRRRAHLEKRSVTATSNYVGTQQVFGERVVRVWRVFGEVLELRLLLVVVASHQLPTIAKPPLVEISGNRWAPRAPCCHLLGDDGGSTYRLAAFVMVGGPRDWRVVVGQR